MTSNHRRYLILQETVDDVSGSAGSEEKDIVILPPVQGNAYATDVEEDDVDECHKNDLLQNDAAGTLEVLTTINAKSLPTYQQFKVKKTNPAKEKECESSALKKEKQFEGNTRRKCYVLS